jgi:hypothetical protein
LGDETSYQDHGLNPDQESSQDEESIQDHETSQEPVTQDQSGDFALNTEMQSQEVNDPGLGVEETHPEAVVFAEPAVEIRAAEPAPLVAIPSPGAEGDGAVGDSARELLGLPLQFLNQLLQRIGSTKLDSLADLIPVARLVGIALLAGVALKFTGATLGAINDIPFLGGLLELTGLVAMLNFLARNALKQQKRAELLGRIRKLKQDFLG